MEELSNLTLYGGLGGAFIATALVEVVKRTFGLDDEAWKRYLPLCSILIGVAWNALLASLTNEIPLQWNVVLFLGIFTGLSASGLYSGAKAASGK